MLRYTLLRLLIFFAVLLVLWLCTLRGWPLLVLSAFISAILSLFVLQGPRDVVAQKVERKVHERQEKAQSKHRIDTDAEDDYADEDEKYV